MGPNLTGFENLSGFETLFMPVLIFTVINIYTKSSSLRKVDILKLFPIFLLGTEICQNSFDIHVVRSLTQFLFVIIFLFLPREFLKNLSSHFED
ncbi:MAG: hypothetical protein DRR16_27850 [Candidatus Parabeggiatoa sp. nov. 3]|nr:MAG: hypothetical protein DRR00_29480 [Gammaproteobacteria bacterium]RKZ56987.1 MAG: hypothetical protein DRQ99_27675 [Gammaproteobacteria bacterium]RKZ78346.1 MAG: hypothetical protein DRR16_27850 [Gammaproteobacteria bacterium]